LIASRALAAELARHVALSGDGIGLHVSGCAKGCAHPKAAPFTIVGVEQGCGIVRDGSARDEPAEYVDPADVGALRHRIATREAVHA
jgi:precorrin-3B synthase